MPIYGITYRNRVLLDEVNLFIFICIQKLVSKAVSRVADQLVPTVTVTSSENDSYLHYNPRRKEKIYGSRPLHFSVPGKHPRALAAQAPKIEGGQLHAGSAKISPC